MIPPRLTVRIAAAMHALCAVWVLAAEPSHLRPVPSVLLLQNGQALAGNISRAGDTYFVGLPNGEIRVKAGDVELWCRDLEEGYQRKRAAIRPGDVRDHLELARWCIHHGLEEHARSELDDASAADPRHPMIGLLRRRLQAAARPAEHPVGVAKPADPPDLPVSVEELDRLVRGMPHGSVEAFAQSIQPLLVNNCAAAGCHGPNAESEFRLLRPPPGGAPSRRLTQRNLYATLQWIDREEPEASSLLTTVLRPHGTATTPIFTHRQVAQYQQLARWVGQLAQRPKPTVPATVDLHCGAGGRAMPSEPSAGDLPRAEGPAAADPLGAAPWHGAGSAVDSGQPGASTIPFGPERQPPPSPFVPIDPFDPEIFNRRFFGP